MLIHPFPLGSLAQAALAELEADPVARPAAPRVFRIGGLTMRKGPATPADPQRMMLHAVVLASGEQILLKQDAR